MASDWGGSLSWKQLAAWRLLRRVCMFALPCFYPFPPIYLQPLWETGHWTRWILDMTMQGHSHLIQWEIRTTRTSWNILALLAKYSLLPQNSWETGVFSCFLMSQCWPLKVSDSHAEFRCMWGKITNNILKIISGMWTSKIKRRRNSTIIS